MPITDPEVLLKEPDLARSFLGRVINNDPAPPPEPSPEHGKHFEGQDVVVHGLVNKPELNGQRGWAIPGTWDAASGRVGVKLPSPSGGRGAPLKVKLKAENLQLWLPSREESELLKEERQDWDAEDALAQAGPDEAQAPVDGFPELRAAVAAAEGGPPEGAGAAEVIRAMKGNLDNMVILNQGLHVLGSIAHGKPTGKLSVSCCSGPSFIVEVMARHAKQAELVAVATQVLGNVANGDISCKNSVFKADAIQVVSDAARAHPDLMLMQLGACGLFANLANGGDPKFRQALLKAGCPSLIVKAMSRFKDDATLQQQACLALTNLACGGGSSSEAVCDAGAPAALVRTLERWASNAAVRTWAVAGLRNLACGSGDCKQTLSEERAHVAMVRMMKAYPEDCELQKSCCAAMALMAQDEEAKAEIIHTAAVGAAVAAMDRYQDDPTVQLEACLLFVPLALQEGAGGRAAVADAGAPKALARCLAKFPPAPPGRDPERQRLRDIAEALLKELG